MILEKYVTKIINLPLHADTGNNRLNLAMAIIVNHLLEQYQTRKVRFAKKTEFVDVRYVKIHSKKFKQLLGSNYKETLEELSAKNLISVQINRKTGSESYSNGSNSFPKKYKVNDDVWSDLINSRNENISVIVPNPMLSDKFATKKIRKPKVSKTEARYQGILDNLSQLHISDEVFDDPAFDYFSTNDPLYVKAFRSNNHNISDGGMDKDFGEQKTGRTYNTVIKMKRELRKYIRHSSGKSLEVIDASAANPTFLATFISDDRERLMWLKYCHSGDFYTELVGEPSESKEIWKPKFMAAMSNKPLSGKEVTTIRECIKRKFPTLHLALDGIHASGKSVASKLGRLETRIFRETFECEERFQLSMHDGLLVLTEDLEYFKKAIQEKARSILGYDLKLKTEPLGA